MVHTQRCHLYRIFSLSPVSLFSHSATAKIEMTRHMWVCVPVGEVLSQPIFALASFSLTHLHRHSSSTQHKSGQLTYLMHASYVLQLPYFARSAHTLRRFFKRCACACRKDSWEGNIHFLHVAPLQYFIPSLNVDALLPSNINVIHFVSLYVVELKTHILQGIPCMLRQPRI